MKSILINVIIAIPIVYILLLLSRIFKELGHLVMYKILFEDDNYKITIGYGKKSYKQKDGQLEEFLF
ncbi:hypothetical protein HMPREF9489_1293 [Finegoldia magna SY403409CC001050417]|uniref:Uncharacterized protein n=1 Tax=Finegoldia magna TaxID=1260 RepID=A0A7D4FKY2_FINMA|nr:hypothetical protein [Finegoldia magna]EGS34433.1 hypothetical protein HMPREF9489_1293 [Finegoldia magna SY403409CC001050417]QKH79487.1 hypothetical protein FOC70_03585 [Finegoldia magna]